MQTQVSGCTPRVVPNSLFAECIMAFYFMISGPAPNTRTRGEVRAYYSTGISERLVERHKSSLAADSHLAYNVLQKTSSTRKVFSFCQPF